MCEDGCGAEHRTMNYHNYIEITAMILFGIGLTLLVLDRNLIKKNIAFAMTDSAMYLFLAAKGYVEGREAPIVTNGVQSVTAYINPIPSGLVLTGIVVSVSVTSLLLALTVRLYRRYHTLDLDLITSLARKEEN